MVISYLLCEVVISFVVLLLRAHSPPLNSHELIVCSYLFLNFVHALYHLKLSLVVHLVTLVFDENQRI
jgi:hypothetical protein